jgi:hypothetical protein
MSLLMSAGLLLQCDHYSDGQQTRCYCATQQLRTNPTYRYYTIIVAMG